jgi:uncharacterized protein YcaQ
VPRTPTLDDLRRFAVARTLFPPTTLGRAIAKLGFVQADPIRAPARAQDLILRHRVAGYRAGDLERRYAALGIEEDYLVNYGFLPRALAALLHPRVPRRPWDAATARKAADVLDFVRASRRRGGVHPREVEARFAHGRTTNWFGGTGNAATQLLDAMQHRGLLRVTRREGGTRLYAAVERPAATAPAPEETAARADALVDAVVGLYAPLPARTFTYLVYKLTGGAPQLADALRAAGKRALRERLAHATVDGVLWCWPAGESPRAARHAPTDTVRLLAPFDPIVWDRLRFERLWGWPYRFEAYVPAARRTLGHYALPLLWRDRAIGWATASAAAGDGLRLRHGFAAGQAPRGAEARAFDAAFAAERDRLGAFLAPADRPMLRVDAVRVDSHPETPT